MNTNDRPGNRPEDRSKERSKDWWRLEMKRRLSEKNEALAREAAESRIGATVLEITTARPGLWLAFSATRYEPSLPPVSAASQYAFPKIVADSESEVAASKMNFFVWNGTSHTAAWSDHRFGIREPDVSDASWSPVDISGGAIRGAFIPGLGFDRRLRRLGRGAGFYDRFLKDSRFLKVGVGFAVQITDELPHESHDVELDVLVTDREVIWRMNSNSTACARKVDAS